MDPGSIPEAAWTRRIRAGDAQAFEAFYEEHGRRVVSYLTSRLESRSAAEDVAQDVFLQIWHRREDLDSEKSLRGYLYRVARNAALNHARRRRLELRWATR